MEIDLSPDLDAPPAWADVEPPYDDEPEPKPQSARGCTWQPIDLADVIAGLQAGTITRPQPTIGRITGATALFYRGRVNGVHGDSGAGKTWTALLACAQELAAGEAVLYVDLEDDQGGIVGRLLDLGCDPTAVLDRFIYVHPDERVDTVARDILAGIIATRRPTLAVIDSTGEGLALEGAKPNADEEVAAWFRRLPRFIADRGPAVIVLDHMAKGGPDALWPIGSQRKRAAVTGAQYLQSVTKAFSRDTPGSALLKCAKDRNGNYKSGQRVAELHLDTNDHRTHVELRTPDDNTDEAGNFRPTALMERISDHLDQYPGSSWYGIREAVKGKTDYKRLALDTLIREGYVVTESGDRNSVRHTNTRRFHDAPETGDRSPSPGPPVPVPVPREGDRGTGQEYLSLGQVGDRSGTGHPDERPTA